ncbi:uncharacterized protein LOC116352342 isoform X2 [Contarinia nasturtii]|uniref:uncharacterized protein LOC116352342 isoform X2 n=1 Tax=Contarinia nasturtii TaxID=265458 RepID=UPI0012D45765|nr:uncharacterized protein LOC116352342 isoform X2 [Contarinia nasturtii]
MYLTDILHTVDRSVLLASLQSLFSGSNASINASAGTTASTASDATTNTNTTTTTPPPTTHRSFNPISSFSAHRSSKKGKMGKKVDKEKPPRERWLLTRKTWKYMTDAGRKLIPDYIRGNSNDPQDLKKIEEYFQHVCTNEPTFLPIFRRKQSFPGALGVSPFRRSGKLRHTHKWFGRSTNRLAPISDNKSSGSSNISSPPTKFNSADESEDEGISANENQRMFLIIEMLEKYLKLSSDAEPLNETDVLNLAKESSSSPNEYDSSAFNSPDNMSPPAYGKSGSIDAGIEFQKFRSSIMSSSGIIGGEDSAKKYSFGSIEGNNTSTKLSHQTTFGSSDPSSYSSSRLNRRPIGSQHTSLLLENLRNYGRSNRSSLLSTMHFTPAVLEDKQLLRRIRDELKQQQLDIILKRHSRRPMGSDSSAPLRLSTSLFMLPTLKSVPSRNSQDQKDGITYTLTGIPLASDELAESDEVAALCARVPLISIKYASQEKPSHWNTEETQTDPIPVNNIYQQYHEYLKRQEQEKIEKEHSQKNKNILSKSMSSGACKSGLGDSTTKHSKRKSSIDNEDVSQSVSDTIKRYLRMARKKPSSESTANQFKRINYDTNLRNITSKGEIEKPDELDIGNTKHTQTNDNWTELVIEEIKAHMSADEYKQLLSLSDCPENYHHNASASSGERKLTSSSTPTSPTGFFHTSSWTKDSIFGHKKEDSSIANMQKSKSSSNVGQVFSKKIWKSRSKSQTRPDSPAQPHWTPQGNCIWKSSTGKYLHLKKAYLHELSDVERKSLQRIALDRINQLNIGVPVKLPSETTTTDGLQPKSQKRRAPLLLKRKALTTSFFDSSKIKSDGRKGSTSNASGGLIFGQPLEKCLSNDNAFAASTTTTKQKGSDDSGGHKFSRKSRCSITSLDAALPGSAISSDGNYSGSCDSLFSKHDSRFTASNSGDSLSDVGGSGGGLGNSLEDDDASSKFSNGSARQTQPQVPPLILACIDHLTNYGLHVVGIFRVSTSKRRIRELREELDCGSLKTFDSETSPHDVASLLKEYLRDLPEPLLCRSLYPAFLSTQKIRNRRLQLEALSHLIQLLPIAHRDTLYVLLKFLALVARCSDDVMNLATNTCISVGNKMDSANLATVIAPNILHSNTDASSAVATDEQAEERLDVINVVRTMIDHYEELFAIPPDVMDDVYTVIWDTHPEQLDYIFDRKDSYEVNNSRKDESTTSSPKKSPGAKVHAHFFPQHSQERFDPYEDVSATPGTSAQTEDGEQPRRMYVREQFTHENTVRGNVAEPSDNIRRRERGSRTKSLIPDQESVFSRRRRRVPSSSNTITPLTDDGIRYNLNLSPPTTPTSKSNNSNNEVLLASLKLPVQMVNTSAIHADIISTAATPLSLTSDLSDIPYIEDAETNNGYRSTTTITPPQQSPTSKTLSSIAKKSGFPLTKLKSQFKPAQLTLTTVPIDQGTKDVDKLISAAQKQTGNNTIEPHTHSIPVMTAITNIGGDMMRSKTAEFERMMTNQQQQQNKSISKSHSQTMQQSHGSSGARTTDTKCVPLKTSDSSPNVRNGPIYKRRDVISSALNLKK